MGFEQIGLVPEEVQVQNQPVYKRFIERQVDAPSLNDEDLYVIVRNTGSFPVVYGNYLGPDAEIPNVVRFRLLSDNPRNPPSSGVFSIPQYTFYKIKDDVPKDVIRSLVGHSTGNVLGGGGGRGRRKRKSSRKYKYKSYTQRKNKGKRKSRRVK